MAAVLRQLGLGPVHLVGSSTGGAIAQVMALDHPDVTRSIVLADSWAKPDAYFRHQFAVRRRTLTELGPRAYAEASALFLFGQEHFRDRFSEIEEWIDLAGQADASVGAQRIDMILAFDESQRLADIQVPSLVVVGDADICTPVSMSEELVGLIPGATLEVLNGGHLIYKERPEAFFEVVDGFLASLPAL
jgi:aminoacrylate hydrolase